MQEYIAYLKKDVELVVPWVECTPTTGVELVTESISTLNLRTGTGGGGRRCFLPSFDRSPAHVCSPRCQSFGRSLVYSILKS